MLEKEITKRKHAEELEKKAREEMETLVTVRTAELAQALKALEKVHKELIENTSIMVQNEKLAILGEIAAGVAHELNQPLSGIKLTAQSLAMDIRKNRFDENILPEYLTDILEQVNRMAETINHISRFSRRQASGDPRPYECE